MMKFKAKTKLSLALISMNISVHRLFKYLDIFAKAVKFGDESWLNGFREPLLLSRMFK